MLTFRSRGSKIVVVGTGLIGTSYAFTMMNQGLCEELVLVDQNHEKAEGYAMDLNFGLPFAHPIKIWAGDYTDCQDADIVVITTCADPLLDETQDDSLEQSAQMIRDIVDHVMASGFDGIFLIATHPTDILSYVSWKYSGLPSNRIIGLGTILDTARLKYLLGQVYQVNPIDVHAYIMGEQGETEFPVWSHADIGRRSIADHLKTDKGPSQRELDQIFENVRDTALHITERKGIPFYSEAMGLVRLTRAILHDEHSVLTVSCLLSGEYDLRNLYISVPAVVNRTGVQEIIELNLPLREKEKLRYSANILKRSMSKILIR
ncbi:L-lactate dehydrogenase [Hazenella coriacea]|uniref:L-lactate dehydrogenase n=1 Tax=Hazenella coriacea TaxID=1179467 RepID=A0A4R3LB83_9BACL|nr:L-lactate dehydrogenase [Hazenella coriacea]TCS97029.1 L-lactate dehydrogenase [Hazenella coriacea]